MPRIHKRSESWQSDMPVPSVSSKINPFKFMQRNVSWDPAITVMPDPKTRQRPPYASSSSYSREPKRPTLHPLHPLLSPETNAIWDARLAPAPTAPATSAQTVTETATATGARHLRIVSREFPWTIEVENHGQNAVTCADVFHAIYTGLSVPITPSEWTLADDSKRESVKRANRNRGGRRLRRIDWLGSRVHFKGLSRDDALGRTRLLPEDDLWPDTWAVKFGSR